MKGKKVGSASPSPFTCVRPLRSVGGGSGWGFGFFYNLKIAIRNLRRNGIYSTINIVGLAVSLAACILIFLWVQHEMSFDRFHKNTDNLYRVNTHVDNQHWGVTPSALAPMMKQDLPEVELVCRVLEESPGYLETNGEKFYNEKVAFVDTTFFSIFGFKIVSGNTIHLTGKHSSVVISQSTAKKMFGDKDPLGETIKVGNGLTFQVDAVMEDMPSNSSMQYSLLFFHNWYNNSNWGGFQYYTYVQLSPGCDAGAMDEKITAIVKKYHTSAAGIANFYMDLQNIKKIHLYTPEGKESGMQTVRLFFIIAVLILVIACINYVNLVTARATKRSKEIGLRKVVGASKANLFGQFLNEAVLVFFAALLLAVIFTWCIMPYYNNLTAKTFDIVSSIPHILKICVVAFVAVLLLAGLYPAFTLVSFQPVEAFKSQTRQGKNSLFRKMLVVTQFVFSAGLILATLVIGRQLSYIQNINPGYDKGNVLMVPMRGITNHFDAAKSELFNVPGIKAISAANMEINEVLNQTDGVSWEGKDPNITFMIAQLYVDKDFISMMGLKLLQGANFTATDADSSCFIINETTARLVGMNDPVGKPFEIYGIKGSITGVLEDFHFDNMHKKIGPIVLLRSLKWTPSLMYVRIEPGKTRIALENIEKVWKQYNADYQFTYKFVDDTFEEMHRSDLRTGKLFNIFAIIAIFISCLGLFGLVTYTAETKTKEIGVRKVLGASIAGIVEMISKEFLILVFIAMLIAFPLAFWLLNGILEDFAYRIHITLWMFIVAAAIVILLTLITVGFQAIKAATANPIKSLKTE